MKMKVNPALLPTYLTNALFKEHGDYYEREYGHFLMTNFPNCERFWKAFVIPSTERMEGQPNTIAAKIYHREGIDPEIEDIGSTHYSMFMNLVFAHLHLEHKSFSAWSGQVAH
jgi:hypothetical protein